VVYQRATRVLFAVAGNLLRPRGDLPISLPRRIVDLDRADFGFHRRDHRRESARSRYHLRLFRSREPALAIDLSIFAALVVLWFAKPPRPAQLQ